jgi:hypothetical protein
MKYAFYATLLVTLIVCGFQACQKNRNNIDQNSATQNLIKSSKQFFEKQARQLAKSPSGNDRIGEAKSPDWAAAKVLQLSDGPAVIVPVHYLKTLSVKTSFGGPKLFNLNEISQLIVYKDAKSTYQAELVTAFPDSNDLNSGGKKFTGITFVEDWSGKRLSQFKYNSDGAILHYTEEHGVPGKISGAAGISTLQVKPATLMVTCYEISGYNYSADDPDGGYFWTESAGCDYQYLPDGAGGSGSGGLSGSDYGSIGGGGSARLTTPQITIPSGPNIIASAAAYFNCFTNAGGTDHQYTVTVCVDQPTPGTRQAWGYSDGPAGSSAAGNPFDVGHVFLIFSETYGGTTITRNVGFYPRTKVYPWSASDQGQLNDNESSIYNISLTATIDNAQFFNMLNYVSQGNNPGYLYNLNNNNCTTFALMALQAGSVNLPTQIGTWPGGSGYDPGDLGEDIRNMPLPSNMTRNTVENPHANVGSCN